MKAMILTGKLVQDHEYIYPYYRLQEAGYVILTALPKGEATFGSLGTKIPCDDGGVIVSHCNIASLIDDIDLLILPGGAKCMEYIRQDRDVIDFISEFNKTGKLIGSICHGAQLLISAKVVKGRMISGYYSIRDDIENAGAEYMNAPAVVSENLVTCPHYKYLGAWMHTILQAVK